MPVTRGRAAAAAAAAAAADEEERHAPIDISSDSDAGGSEQSGSEDEDDGDEPTSDKDYIDISDSGESCVDISDSGESYVDISDSDSEDEEDDDEEGGCAGNEGGAEADRPGADRSEAACTKIADLLRRGRNLDGIKLAECKAYLKNNGLPQVGDIETCVERIMLHHRFKDEDPEKIYPRSSFCINCKGDVCRGDTVLFKQKVHEKSGKRLSKSMGKRIVAGKVIKESYGKDKQQHTFTIQVFWSKGVGKLPPLYLLLVKGRNLYRMMTFRQAWANEANRLKALEEKHSRGDAVRRVRASNRRNSRGHALKGKKSKEKGKHQSQPGGPDGGSNITKGRKRAMQTSNSDHPAKKVQKEEHQVPSGKNHTGDHRKAKTNSAPLDKNIGTSTSSSQLNANTETNHAIPQKNLRTAPVNNGLRNTEARVSKGKAGSKQKNTVGGNHDQFEGRRLGVGSASHRQAYPGNSAGIHRPFSERPQRPPPLREVGNAWQPPLREVGNAWQHHMDDRSISCPNPAMVFGHPYAAPAGWRAPGYFREPPPDQRAVVFPPFHTSQTIYRRHPDGAYVMPQYRYSGGSHGFPR
ncbi:hypothetical protein CFC21_022449 [Triticum aestivum]|uniref:DUF7699 domain-containing protein n=2 Tax=Triticum aestivum TaxID=4565 RepID=A0A3B6C2E8_WHEAT|nr:zinc finger CCCH domain-containing protein 62-like [Triticum dicoccoides]XP_044322778.1 zinc finger CCCH domain-containing protein 62-like [Triticum aestivum]KAF7007519.1 hypothetical protein CFC21_022449 [Triticum aestivum]